MVEPVPVPFRCRFESIRGICAHDEFCGFEAPSCEGCPKSLFKKGSMLDDPMRSIIWRNWIDGMSRIKK